MARDPVSEVASWVKRLRDEDRKPTDNAQTAADDDEILSCFREWIQARRAPGYDSEDNDYDREVVLENKIATVPAAGMAGLIVKMYLRLHPERRWWHVDDAAISGDGPDIIPLDYSIIRDMASLLPELAPLVNDYLNLERSVPHVVALVKKIEVRRTDEEARRDKLLTEECDEFLKPLWDAGPVTNADYREIVRKVIARHPAYWFDEEKLSEFGLLEDAGAELIEPLKRKATAVYEAAIATPEPAGDPIVTWIAARRDLDSVWHESSVDGSDLDGQLSDHIHDFIENLDERIADTVATTIPGLVGQVARLAEHNGGIGCDTDKSYFGRLQATINAGIERLAGHAG